MATKVQSPHSLLPLLPIPSKAVPSYTPHSPSISPMSSAVCVNARRCTQTRFSGGPVPPPPLAPIESLVPSYPQRNNAPHSPPETPHHTQSCKRNCPMRSRNPSPSNPIKQTRASLLCTSKRQKPTPSSQSIRAQTARH